MEENQLLDHETVDALNTWALESYSSGAEPEPDGWVRLLRRLQKDRDCGPATNRLAPDSGACRPYLTVATPSS